MAASPGLRPCCAIDEAARRLGLRRVAQCLDGSLYMTSVDTGLAFVFPGQGSQSVGMLAELAGAHPEIQASFAEASQALGYDLWALVAQGPEERLSQTEYTQPALLAASVGVWRAWQAAGGATPAALSGHSLRPARRARHPRWRPARPAGCIQSGSGALPAPARPAPRDRSPRPARPRRSSPGSRDGRQPARPACPHSVSPAPETQRQAPYPHSSYTNSRPSIVPRGAVQPAAQSHQ